MPLESINMHEKKGEKFQATPDEMRTIADKMKDPEFMKLMMEYMQDLQNPEYRKEEEEYLKQVEKEAHEGGDDSFDFIFPKPSFVVELKEGLPTVRTTTKGNDESDKNKSKKSTTTTKTTRVYINVCTSDKIEESREETTGDRWGSKWLVPVSVGKPHNETSHDGHDEECRVYDAVFHPKTVGLANMSDKFLCFLVEIAVENINGGYKEKFGFAFNRLSSSISSVGTPQNQTVKRPKGSKSPFAAMSTEPMSTKPMRPSELHAQAAAAVASGAATPPTNKPPSQSTAATTTAVRKDQAAENLPPVNILHRGEIEIGDAWNWKVSDKRIGVPKELVVKITFTGVKSAAHLDIEVKDGCYIEISKAPDSQHPYHGCISLPFTVDPTPMSAKFDKGKSILTLSLKTVAPLATEASAEHFRRQKEEELSKLEEHVAVKSMTQDEVERKKDEETAAAAAAVVAAEKEAAEKKQEAEEQDDGSSSKTKKKEVHFEDPKNNVPTTYQPSKKEERKEANVEQVKEDTATHQQTSSASTEASHSSSADRITQMMQKLEEARKEREAAEEKEKLEEEENKKKNEKKKREESEITSSSSPKKEEGKKEEKEEETVEVIDLRDRQKEWLDGVKKSAAAKSIVTFNDEEENDGYSNKKENDDGASLVDAMAKMSEEAVEAARKQEEEEREAKRKQKEARKRVEAEKEEERLEAIKRVKMAELPLRSNHIFDIE